MTREFNSAALFAAALCLLLAPSAFSQDSLKEFQWNVLNPSGTPSWTTAANWVSPGSPPGNADYPDDPMHTDVSTTEIGPVVGANLAVGLQNDLNVSIGSGNITISSLKLGVNNFNTTVSGSGMLLFEQDEPSLVKAIPDPDPDAEPGDMVDEVTCSFNCGPSLVQSLGAGSGTNVISATVGSTETIDFSGPRTLTLSGGLTELAIGTADDASINNVNIRSHIGVYDPSTPIENQTRLIVTGPVTTAVDNFTNPDNVLEDQPLQFNRGGSGTPEFLSAANTEMGQGFAQGIIDLRGGITGGGRVLFGTDSRSADAVPLGTVVLYDNSYTGRTIINRGNVVLRHNNAFGPSGSVVNGFVANELGYNLIVEAGPEEDPEGLERVIANDFSIPHDFTVKGSHSLRILGDSEASNSGSWINLLPEGEKLTLAGRIYTSENPDNFFSFDGSGLTIVEGQIRNTDLDEEDGNAEKTTRIRKLGSGVTYINSSLHMKTNTFKRGGDNPNSATILIDGGVLHFAAIGDMGDPSAAVASTGGAIGVDTGTIAAINDGSGNFAGRFNNFANRPANGAFVSPTEVPSWLNYDNGALMLTNAADASANLNFTTGALANFQDMSVAATEGGTTFTGTITPANDTYRLGGGVGTLTIAASKLASAGNLEVTNGGDYKNPNGEDRVQLGMVRITGTTGNALNTVLQGRYHSTLQDQAAADDVELAEEDQYHGTTLAVESLADGASSIGSSTSAESLVIQGSTLRYEGAAGSTNRLFTIGTAGATLDASGAGAINFTNTSALAVDTAQSRSGDVFGLEGLNVIYDLGDTSDLQVGMTVTSSNGYFPADTVITAIPSPTRIQLNNNLASEFAYEENFTVTFADPERSLYLTGDNTGDNTLSAQISDSANGGVVGVEKSGSGKWILDNAANSYTGDTVVEAGTLSLGAAFLADDSDVLLYSDATLDLNFSGADDINSLFFDDQQLAGGTWGSLASSASNKRDWFTGLGVLNILEGVVIGDLAGDFNRDGVVDAADYTVWRDNFGGDESAIGGNGDGVNGVDDGDYSLWRANYGKTVAAPSAGSGVAPEPAAVLLMLAAAPLASRRKRR